MTESTTDDVENPLNEEQVARAGALGIAKEVLKRAPGPFGGAASPDVLDLVRLARYILTGSEEPAVDLEPALTLEDTLPRVYMEDTLPRVYMGDLAAVTIVSMALDDGIIVLPGNSPDGSVEAKDVDEPEADKIAVANALVDAITIAVKRAMDEGTISNWRELVLKAIEDARPYQPTMRDAQKEAIRIIGDGRSSTLRRVLEEMGVQRVNELQIEQIPEFLRRIAPPAAPPTVRDNSFDFD